MAPHKRLALGALVFALIGPLCCLSCAVWHGMGPCGPANLAGLMGCGGVLICVPGALILGFAALLKYGKDLDVGWQARERKQFWKRVEKARDRGKDEGAPHGYGCPSRNPGRGSATAGASATGQPSWK